MFNGNLINDLMTMVEHVEARLGTQDEPDWGALIAEQTPSYELVNQTLAGVA